MALINIETLPSRFKYKFPSININQFTYKSLLDYLDNLPSNPSDLYLYDFGYLSKDDPNIGELLVTDAEYLVFLKKAISVNESDIQFVSEITCPHCGTTSRYRFYGSDFKFTRPSDELVYNGVWMELTSGTFLCKIPTLNRMYKVLEYTKAMGITRHLDLVKSIAMVNEFVLNPNGVEKAILEAGAEDIPVIIKVYDMLYRSLLPVPKKCSNSECDLHSDKSGGMPIEINSLIGNVFRSILLSRPVDSNKVYTK